MASHPVVNSGCTTAPTRQGGIAVITAMFIVAIVATVAAFLALGQQLWLRQSQNLADRAQAEAVRRGALEWAAIILTEDAKDNSTDDLAEPWALALPPLPAEGGLVTGNISDAQARFNLNNLLREDNVSAEHLSVFQRLLESQDLPRELAESLVDWLDVNNRVQPNGAEDLDYLNLEPPYRSANQPLQSVGELRLVKGFDAKAVATLRPFVTALPEATAININTAPPAVFSALFTDLSPSEAEELIAEREGKPFKKKSGLKERLPSDVALPKVPYDVKSAYFEVTVDTLFGRLQRRTRALLYRPAEAAVKILWQQRQLLVEKTHESGR